MELLINSLCILLLMGHGIWSIISSFKNTGKSTFLFLPNNRYILDKLIGERRTNDFLGSLFGLVEVIFGIFFIYHEIIKKI